MTSSHADTLRLFDRAQGGDALAMEELLERYEERIQRIVAIRGSASQRSILRSRRIVREVLQNALCALEHLWALDDASVVWRLSLEVQERIEELLARGDCEPDVVPGAEVARDREREQVDEALVALPETWREVFLLRHFMGFAFVRIAQEIDGLTPHDARAIYRRARVQLVDSLDGMAPR